MSFNLDGLSSGLPTNDVINQLMEIERLPLYSYEEEKADLKAEKDAWRDVNSRIDSLESKLTTLKLSSTYDSNKTSSSAEDIVTATATSEATQGNYEIDVDKLAKAQRVASDMQVDSNSELNLSGTININEQSITIESTDSLTDIKNTINDTDNVGVQASIINNTLVLESTETGIANQIQVEDNNSVLANLGIINSGSLTNKALTATVSASSQFSNDYPVSSVNDGITDSTNWGSGQGWNDATGNDFTDDWVELDFASNEMVDRVVLNTLDNVDHSAADYGVKDYQIQYWDENTGSWQTADSVTGNDQGEVISTFDAVDTKKLRVKVNDSNNGDYSRIVELEAYNTGEQFKNVLQGAQDAELSINNIDVTSSSNSVTDAVTGVSFDIKNTTTDPVNITVNQDSEKTVAGVQAFVDQYNSLMDFINTKTSYDPETKKSSILQGDGTLMRLQMRLRSMATDTVENGSKYNSLAMVGVEIDRDGVMSLDSSKLNEALAEAPEDVMNLFKAESDDEGFDGVATRMDSYVDQLIQTNTGTIPRRLEFFDDRIDDIDDSIADFERRLESTKERYIEQFTAMEKAISEMQQQGNWLMSQLSGMGNTSLLGSTGGGQQ